MTQLRQLSIFLALLVVSLPFVHAQSLQISSFGGTDKVEGFVSSPDVFTITATASIPEDDAISADQLRVKVAELPGYLIFGSCQGSGESTTCTYQQDIYQVPAAPFNVRVQLMDDDNKYLDTAIPLREVSKTLNPDSIGASTESISATASSSRDGSFTFNVLARDRGISTDESFCSGVDKVEIRKRDGRVLATQQGNKECSFAFNIDVSLAQEPDGEYDICAHAFDRLGQIDLQHVSCTTILKDSGPPRISSVELFQEGERALFIRPTADNLVDVAVEFDDPGLVQSSVRADFSSITSNPSFRDVPPSEFDGNTATWLDVPTNGMSECLVRLSATDSGGNSISDEAVTCSAGVDSLGPRVVSINAGLTLRDIVFLSQRSKIIAVIEDDFAGVDREDIRLDLSEINGLRNVEPDICKDQAQGRVECTWLISTSRTGTARIIVEPGSTDRLGNPLREQSSLSVVIDSSPPEIDEVVFHVFSGKDGTEKKPPVAVRDDTLQVIAVSKGTVRAEGNFSGVGVEELVTPQCVTAGTESECTFSAVIEATADTNEPIKLYFYDEAGNRAVHSERVRVFESMDSENPDFWRTERVICSPDFIDNAVTEFVNFKITCGAILKPFARGSRIIHVDLDPAECTDEGAVAEITLSNRAAGTTSPIINVLLQTQHYNEPLNFTCPLRITTQIGSSVTDFPEIEEIPISVQFYENPLGEAGDQLDRKVLGAIKDAQGAWEIVGTLKEIMSYLEKVCQTKSAISNLLLVLNTLYTVIHTIGSALVEVFGIGFAIIAVADVIGVIHNVIDNIFNATPIFEIIDSMCVIIGCTAASSDDDSESLSAIGGGTTWCTDIQRYLNELIPQIGPEYSTSYTDGVSSGESRQVVGEGSVEETQLRGGVPAGDDPGTASPAPESQSQSPPPEPPPPPAPPPAPAPEPTPAPPTGPPEVTLPAPGAAPVVGPPAPTGSVIVRTRPAPSELTGGVATDSDTEALPDEPDYAREIREARENTERTDVPGRSGFMINSLNIQPINIKESIIWSTVCLCLPGIIHNLEKFRQLQCKYAVCMAQDVREKGLPVSFCDEQKAYDECAFLFNQIFNAIPFAQVFSDFGALLENLLTDPFALVSQVLGILCTLCTPETPFIGAACGACKYIQDVSKVADAVLSLKSFAESLDTFFEVDDGYCGQMEDLEKEINQERAAQATPPAEESDIDEGITDITEDVDRLQDQDRFEEVVEAEGRDEEIIPPGRVSSGTRGGATA